MPNDPVTNRDSWTSSELVEAHLRDVFAFSDSEGQLFCPSCGENQRGLTPLRGKAFSASDLCTDCGVELRGPIQAGKYHEYERQTVRELGEHLEPWPIDDVQH